MSKEEIIEAASNESVSRNEVISGVNVKESGESWSEMAKAKKAM